MHEKEGEVWLIVQQVRAQYVVLQYCEAPLFQYGGKQHNFF